MRLLRFSLLILLLSHVDSLLLAVARPPSRELAEPAAESRAEYLKQRRIAKMQTSAADLPGGVERAFLWLEESSFLEINYKGLYPQFSNFGPGAGVAPGVRFWKPNLNGTTFDLQSSAAYSTRSYQKYDLQFGRILLSGPVPFLDPGEEVGLPEYGELEAGGEKFFFYGDLEYQSRPQEDFFGLGLNSLEQNRTDFKLRRAQIDLVAGYAFNRFATIATRTGFLETGIRRGTDPEFPATQDLFTDQEAPGLDAQPDFYRFHAAFFWDYRDRISNPHQGGIYSVSVSRYQQRGGNQFDFNRYAFDARQFIPLGSDQRVLALHFFASIDREDAGARVPFYLQNTLGGNQTLRSYRNFRFRGQNRLYLSAEYRWEAAPALEFAFFYDTGKVFSDRNDLDLDGLVDSYGAGVRFKTLERVILRLDFAWGQEGRRVFLTFGPVF